MCPISASRLSGLRWWSGVEPAAPHLHGCSHLSHDRAVFASRVRRGHHRLAVISAMHGAALLRPQPTPLILKASDMAAFSVFFCDQERCSIQPVRAMDPDHAIAQVRSQVPDLRRVAVVPDELLDGVDPQQLLQEWSQVKG